MKSAYFKELERITFDDIKKKLNLDDKNVEELINSAEYNSRRIVKKYYNNKTERMEYSFDFVGIIMFKNCIVKCIPKYYTDIESNKDNILKKIIKVIKKYRNTQDDIVGFSNVNSDKELNYLSIICYILDDYLQYDLYSNDKSIYEMNGNGEIEWERTINDIQEYIVNGRPVYFDLITSEIVNNEGDYIRKIHKYVVGQCSKMLNEHGILDMLSYPLIEFSDAEELYDDTDFVINRITKELDTEFNSRKQELLRTLKLYFVHKQNYGEENYEGFVGTMDFNIVWEKICSSVLENKLENRTKNIKWIEDNYISKDDKGKKLKELIPYPVWKKDGCTESVKATTVKIDIISIIKENGLRYFIIWDAKYYNIKFTEDEIDDNPGVQDIIKQYVYNFVYKKFIKEQKFDKSYNILLFPSEDDTVSIEGKAEFEILQKKLEVDDILVMKMPVEIIFDLYLNNRIIDFKDIINYLPDRENFED